MEVLILVVAVSTLFYMISAVYISIGSRWNIPEGGRLNAVQLPASLTFPMDLFLVDLGEARKAFVVAVYGCRIALVVSILSILSFLLWGRAV